MARLTEQETKSAHSSTKGTNFIGDFFVDAVEIGYSQTAGEVEALGAIMNLSRVGVEIPSLKAPKKEQTSEEEEKEEKLYLPS